MYVFSMAYTKLQITYGACPILFFPLLCHCLYSSTLSYRCYRRCYFGYFSLPYTLLFFKKNGKKRTIKIQCATMLYSKSINIYQAHYNHLYFSLFIITQVCITQVCVIHTCVITFFLLYLHL